MFELLHSYVDIDTIKVVFHYVEIFFILYIFGYSTFLFISVITGGHELFESIKKDRLKNLIKNDYYIPVSIVVPAYNEEVTITKTINSLLHLDYRLYEIVIVNDGSTDSTLQTLIDTYKLKKVHRPICKSVTCSTILEVYEVQRDKVRITLINKVNGGKADSINAGINASEYPYFVCMDADSVLEKDSLAKLVTPILEDQNVIAVGSMIRISNDSVFENGKLVKLRLPKKIVPAFQVLEYERSFLASRILLDKSNSNLIISGAFGVFNKEAVLNVGGYDVTSLGEDMEVIVKLHSYYRHNKLPYKIRYAYDAICWTQAPEKLRDVIKQRRRWHIGLYQSLLAHPTLLTKPSYLYYLIYEFLSPFIEIVGLAFIFIAASYHLLDVKYMILFFIAYALFGSLLTIISFITRNMLSDVRVSFFDTVKAILLCIPENILFRFVLSGIRISSLLFYSRKKAKWGKIERVNINYEDIEMVPASFEEYETT